jgi:hypothetical protein
MIEFFLSKVWLFVCGIAVTAVLVMAFSGMDQSVTDDETQRRATQFADVLDSVADSAGSVQMKISVADYLPDQWSVVCLSNGYLSMQTGAEKRYAPLHATMVISDQNGPISGKCQRAAGDVLVVHNDPAKKGCISVQVAKERTTSLIA